MRSLTLGQSAVGPDLLCDLGRALDLCVSQSFHSFSEGDDLCLQNLLEEPDFVN